MLLSLLIIMAVGFVVWVRLAPSDPNVWHIDPALKFTGRATNSFQQTFTLDAPISAVLAAWTIPRQSNEHTELLAGDLAENYVTYVVRTRVLGFPDYVSVGLTSIDDQTTRLSVLSRSRFGISDLGQNRKRILSWIITLRSAL